MTSNLFSSSSDSLNSGKEDSDIASERKVNVEAMAYEDMWKRTLGPYVALYGKSIEYIDEHFGREEAVKWIYKMEEDYRVEHEGLSLSISNFLTRWTPGKSFQQKIAMKIFSMKLQRTYFEYQFLFKRAKHEKYELLDKKGQIIGGRVKFAECPYIAAMQEIPTVVRPKRETFCELDCNGPFHEKFCTFIGFRIKMTPNAVGCTWHLGPLEKEGQCDSLREGGSW